MEVQDVSFKSSRVILEVSEGRVCKPDLTYLALYAFRKDISGDYFISQWLVSGMRNQRISQ